MRKIKRLIGNIIYWVKVPFVLMFFLLGIIGVPWCMYVACCMIVKEAKDHRY